MMRKMAEVKDKQENSNRPKLRKQTVQTQALGDGSGDTTRSAIANTRAEVKEMVDRV
jgi:hypothetical protein